MVVTLHFTDEVAGIQSKGKPAWNVQRGNLFSSKWKKLSKEASRVGIFLARASWTECGIRCQEMLLLALILLQTAMWYFLVFIFLSAK